MADTDSLERIRKALEDLESPPSEENDLARAMARLADERRFAAACNPVAIRSLLAREAALREALSMLYAETADYITLNKLGGLDNQCMKLARAALASTEPTGGHE